MKHSIDFHLAEVSNVEVFISGVGFYFHTASWEEQFYANCLKCCRGEKAMGFSASKSDHDVHAYFNKWNTPCGWICVFKD